MEESVSAITFARVLMALAVPIAKTRLAPFDVKMAEFARCPTTNANVVTAFTEQDATKSNF